MKTRLLGQFSEAKQMLALLSYAKKSCILFLLSILFLSLKSFGQINPGTAPVVTPTGGFAIDGNLQANVVTPNIGDWITGGPGTGGFVLDGSIAGNPLNASTTFHQVDLYNDGMDDNFKGGFKVNNDPNSWKWVKNPVNDKEDINNALVHFSKDANGHLWVIVAADRLNVNGDAYIDFEFLQNKLTITPFNSATGLGGFTSAGPDGGRTVGDFILTLELTNGGSAANFFVERWQSVGGGFNYVDRTSSLPTGSTFAAVNNSPVPVTYDAFGGHLYPKNAFAEAAVDLTALVGNFGPCDELGIKSLFIKTKESQSPTATIVDFIAPALPVNVTIGVADAGKDQAKCIGGASTDFDLSGTASAPPNTQIASTVWSVVPGSGSATFGDDNSATSSSLSTTAHVTSSSVKIVLTVTTDPSTCSPAVTDTVELTVIGQPTIFDLTPGNYCTGEDTHGTITLSSSEAGVSYQLYDAGDNTVQAAKTGTGDVLVWTNIPAGTYYIKATADGGCFSKTSSTTVSENPVPDAPQADVIQPTCIKATGTIIFTSPTGDEFTYSINGTDYQSDPTFNDVASGNYTIYVMNGTGCISTSTAKVNDAPTALDKPAATVVDPTCTVATGTVNVTNPVDGITYTLSQNGQVVYTAVNGVFNNVASGTYAFGATNGTCSADGDNVVVKDQPASPTVTADDKSVCAGSTVELTGTPANGNWTGDHVSGTTFDATGLSAGPYTVTYSYTNDAGCKGSDDATVTVNALPSVSAGSDVSICNGSSTTLTASGATSYLWSPATGLSATTGSTVTANPISTTIYTVTGTDGNTCSNSAHVTVTVNQLPTVTVSPDISICNGGSTTLTASGATSYSWSPVTGLSATTGSTVTANPTSTTTYTVTGTDGNTCSNTAKVKVTVNPVPSCTISNVTSAGSHTTGVGQSVKFSGPSGSGFAYAWSFTSNTAGASFAGGITNTQTVTVTTTTTGAYTLSLKVTDNSYATKCNSTCTYAVTVNTSNGYYTYTQGYYSSTGTSCTPIGGFRGSLALMQYALDNFDNTVGNSTGQLKLGLSGHSFIANYADASKLVAIMPGGGTASKLAKDYNLSTSSAYPPLKNGKIDNVLLSQAITLDLNIHIQGDALSSFVLKTGYLTTQKGDLSTCPVTKVVSCSKDASAISSLQIATSTGMKTWIAGKTVNDLLNLASSALGGAALPSGVSLSDITNAIDAINRSFDGGRFFLGYYTTAQTCSTISTAVANSASTNKPLGNSLSVKAYPNPYNSTVNFHFASAESGKATLIAYDLTGKKLAIIFEGNVNSGSEYDVKYNVSAGNKVPMMYKLTIGNSTYHGMLIPEK